MSPTSYLTALPRNTSLTTPKTHIVKRKALIPRAGSTVKEKIFRGEFPPLIKAVVAFTFLTGYYGFFNLKIAAVPGRFDHLLIYAYLLPLSPERDADSFCTEPGDSAFNLSFG